MSNPRMSAEMRDHANEIDALCDALCKRLRLRYCHEACDCLIYGVPGSSWGERLCDRSGAECDERDLTGVPFSRLVPFSRHRLCKALGVHVATVSNATNGWFRLPQEIEALLRLHEGNEELDEKLLAYVPERNRIPGHAPKTEKRAKRGRPPLENRLMPADLEAFMRRWNINALALARWMNDSIGGAMKATQVTRWLNGNAAVPEKNMKVFSNFNGNPLELPQYRELRDVLPYVLTSWCGINGLPKKDIESVTGVPLNDPKNLKAHHPLIGIRCLNANVWARVVRAWQDGNAPASYPATTGLARRLCDYYRAVEYANLGGGYDRIEARDALWEAIEREVAPVKRDLGWAHNYYDRDHPKAEPFPEGSV